MNRTQMDELIYEALETEITGVRIYQKAIECAQNKELRAHWHQYLEQTRRHEKLVRDICAKLGIDETKETAGRQIVRFIADSLIQGMDMAQQSGQLQQAQIIAAESVLHAETKDHLNWQLIGLLAKEVDEPAAGVLKNAHDEVEDQEDEHFFHSRGWARELWAQSLGIEAVLPPPEEKMNVKNMITAATAEKSRRIM